MSFVIVLICLVLGLGAVVGHLERLRRGADAERRYWIGNLLLLGVSVGVSLAVLLLIPEAHERVASRIVMSLNMVLGGVIARWRFRRHRPNPVSRDTDSPPSSDSR